MQLLLDPGQQVQILFLRFQEQHNNLIPGDNASQALQVFELVLFYDISPVLSLLDGAGKNHVLIEKLRRVAVGIERLGQAGVIAVDLRLADERPSSPACFSMVFVEASMLYYCRRAVNIARLF